MPPRRAESRFLTVAAFATVLVGVLLALGVQTVPVGRYEIHDKGMLGTLVLVAAAFALPLCARMVAAPHPSNTALARKVAILVVTGFALQHGLALAENRGWNGMRDRMVGRGHAEFALEAGKLQSAWAALRDYETIAAEKSFLPSKPPGQLLFYMAVADLADAVVPDRWSVPPPDRPEVETSRQWRLINTALFVYPLLSMLTLLPLTYLGLALLGRDLALWPAFLYMLCPPVQLVTLHLDQTLYPLLVTTLWAFAVRAVCVAGATRDDPGAARSVARTRALWAGAGALAWLAQFVSFSVLPAFPLTAVLVWAARATIRKVDRPLPWRPLLRGALLALAVFALLTALLAAAAGYNPLHAFQRSLAHHHRWMRWNESLRWPAARLNLLEFFYWIGPPIVLAFGWQCAKGIASLVRRRIDGRSTPAMGTAAILAATAIFGATYGEVARLWLFLVPAVILSATPTFAHLVADANTDTGADVNASTARRQRMLLVTAALQGAWMFCLKAMQDFA
ncbi:hypothetical protein [Pendulispora albinea]|uniref:Uncharacterized protein n=1 Tax=Pendulispora albinea TaxID=2741071 RepID=A0ABZ2MBK5_9BACT